MCGQDLTCRPSVALVAQILLVKTKTKKKTFLSSTFLIPLFMIGFDLAENIIISEGK